MSNSKFWQDYKEIRNMLNKQAFIQMPGGQSQDKQAQDPTMAGGMPTPGMDPAATGMDPSMAGGMPPPGMDPAAMGMDPSMVGGIPPPGIDPSMTGGMPAPITGTEVPGEQTAAPGSPMITISLDQLFEIIQKVLGLAKKVGANGQGIQQPAATASADAQGLTQDQLKATIYEALGSIAG